MKSIILQTFTYFQILHCIVTIPDSSGRSYGDWYWVSIEPIRSFLVSHGSWPDSETPWLHDVKIPTYPTDTFILSQKTGRSVIEAEWADRAELVLGKFGQCLTGQNRKKTEHVRAGQGRMRTGEAAFLDFSHILVYCTRVSALSICPIVRLLFFLINLLSLKRDSSYFNKFWELFLSYCSQFLSLRLWM